MMRSVPTLVPRCDNITEPPSELEAHVWHANLSCSDDVIAEFEGLLSEDECARARQFHFDRHRLRYIAARGLLRTMLAGYTRCHPRKLTFAYGPRGKPQLAPDSRLRFNISHTEDRAVFAFAWERDVGVDVEHIREDVDVLGVAAHDFTIEEAAQLRALAPAERTLAFFVTWTRKEAFIKARGDGLGMPLDSFEVATDPLAPPRLVSTRRHPMETQRWTLFDLQAGPGLAAAMAVEGSVECVREFVYVPGNRARGAEGGHPVSAT